MSPLRQSTLRSPYETSIIYYLMTSNYLKHPQLLQDFKVNAVYHFRVREWEAIILSSIYLYRYCWVNVNFLNIYQCVLNLETKVDMVEKHLLKWKLFFNQSIMLLTFPKVAKYLWCVLVIHPRSASVPGGKSGRHRWSANHGNDPTTKWQKYRPDTCCFENKRRFVSTSWSQRSLFLTVHISF